MRFPVPTRHDYCLAIQYSGEAEKQEGEREKRYSAGWGTACAPRISIFICEFDCRRDFAFVSASAPASMHFADLKCMHV